MSMLFEGMDPNEKFRSRRHNRLRARRRRRAALVGLLLVALAGIGLGARSISGSGSAAAPKATKPVVAKLAAATPKPRAAPDEIRGVHVTVALASIPGKLQEYIDLRTEGLNTIELDVKDENGELGFIPSSVPLAKKVGAARPYYKPREVATLMHASGIYLIGRVVTFEDPHLSVGMPSMAIHNPDGSVWKNQAGLGWTNPYDRRVWDYNVSIAEAAARAGFDEIQFDYVRFPSDGDTDNIVYPGKTKTAPGWVIAQFIQYASKRLKPLGVRVSADVFGLAATRDLGIGQFPARISRYLDAISPMTYPSHFGAGEYDIPDPNADPGTTVLRALTKFHRQLEGTTSELVPWIQDFSLGRDYTLADVQAQIEAARLVGVRGYLLWNPLGVYTPGALAPA